MIAPREIKERAERWWPEVLAAYLTGAELFPRSIPRIGKVKTTERLSDFDRIRGAQETLVAAAGAGYTLHWREIDTRAAGRNRFVDAITIDTRADYLRLLGRKPAFAAFERDAALIRDRAPELAGWLVDNPTAVEHYAGRWPELLAVVRYFLDDHRPGRYYIRELPVAVPTKFVESHRSILADLLDATLPAAAIDATFRGVKNFEPRYGLKYRQPLVRVRLLDADLARRCFSGVDDLSLPLDQFAALDLPLRRVIVLENKTNYANLMNFLTLPEMTATAGIFGSGFHVGTLARADWLHRVELLYWGDLDAHGLQILNQLRAAFPHARSFLMDRATFDALPEYHTAGTPSSVVSLPHLTPEELALYDYLNDACLRLEQERIPQAMVERALGGTSRI